MIEIPSVVIYGVIAFFALIALTFVSFVGYKIYDWFSNINAGK